VSISTISPPGFILTLSFPAVRIRWGPSTFRANTF